MNFLGRPDNIGEDIVRFVAGNGNAGALVSNQKGGRGVKGEGERVNNFRKLPLRSYFLIKRNEILNFIISLQRYELFYLVCDLPLLLDIQREREREWRRNKWHKRRENDFSRGNKSENRSPDIPFD